MSFQTELERATQTLASARALNDIATRQTPADAARLQGVATQLVEALPPLRAGIAAAELGIAEKTVRRWEREGLLKRATAKPRLTITVDSVARVKRVLDDLRAHGEDKNLLDALWYRLSDEAVLSDPDLQCSLQQMSEGKGRRVA